MMPRAVMYDVSVVGILKVVFGFVINAKTKALVSFELMLHISNDLAAARISSDDAYISDEWSGVFVSHKHTSR